MVYVAYQEVSNGGEHFLVLRTRSEALFEVTVHFLFCSYNNSNAAVSGILHIGVCECCGQCLAGLRLGYDYLP